MTHNIRKRNKEPNINNLFIMFRIHLKLLTCVQNCNGGREDTKEEINMLIRSIDEKVIYDEMKKKEDQMKMV